MLNKMKTAFLIFTYVLSAAMAYGQTVNAGPDLATPSGVGIMLQATATGTNLSYKWTPSTYLNKDNILNPIVTPSTTTTYTLTVTSSNGNVVSDQVVVTAGCTFTVGQSYGGGIIYYVDGSGCHGLIAAPNDLSSGIAWWNGANMNIGTSTDYGTGRANTLTIIAAQGSGTYAASIVNGATINGYNDWYLPSRDELNLMALVSNSLKYTLGINTSSYYWSSSADNNNSVVSLSFTHVVNIYQNFDNASQRYSTYPIRPIRSF